MFREKNLWTWLYGGLGSRGHFTRVENVAAEGTPDVNYAIHSREGWMELKSVESLPVRPTTPVFKSCGLRPAQLEWIVQRTRASGTVFILAKAGDSVWLVPGYHAVRFNLATLRDLQNLAVWQHAGRMSRELWDGLEQKLLFNAYGD